MATLLDEQNETRPTELAATSDRLAVIVPVYNEERTVAELLLRLEAQPCVSQIIIVDDGSTDGTWEELAPWRARADSGRAARVSDHDSLSVIVFQHDKNRGKGRAIRTALDQVSGTHVLIQDADLEYDPADITKLWEVMQSGIADVVYGSRYLENPQLQKGRFVLQSGVRILNLLTRLFYGVHLTDQATCYKMFRTNILKSIKLKEKRFGFEPEVTQKVARIPKIRIYEVGISYYGRTFEEGKKINWKDGFHAIYCVLRYGLFK